MIDMRLEFSVFTFISKRPISFPLFIRCQPISSVTNEVVPVSFVQASEYKTVHPECKANLIKFIKQRGWNSGY